MAKQFKSKKKNSKRSHQAKRSSMGGVHRSSMMTMAKQQQARYLRKAIRNKKLRSAKDAIGNAIGKIMSFQKNQKKAGDK